MKIVTIGYYSISAGLMVQHSTPGWGYRRFYITLRGYHVF